MKDLKVLDLMEKASESISDGDLVDALIHGPEQHWTLMPTHSVLSTVRPASFLYGPGQGYAGPNAMSFPQYALHIYLHSLISRKLMVLCVDGSARTRSRTSSVGNWVISRFTCGSKSAVTRTRSDRAMSRRCSRILFSRLWIVVR